MKAYPLLYTLVLIGWLVYALISLVHSAPLLAGSGLMLSCLAPLGFLIRAHFFAVVRSEAHPVMISVLSGFGAVMTMVAVDRFGNQYQIFVLGSAMALAGWLVYVRWFWRNRRNP